MEEKVEENKKKAKKTSTTKPKKSVNTRISKDIIERIETVAEEQTNLKNAETKKTSKKETQDKGTKTKNIEKSNTAKSAKKEEEKKAEPKENKTKLAKEKNVKEPKKEEEKIKTTKKSENKTSKKESKTKKVKENKEEQINKTSMELTKNSEQLKQIEALIKEERRIPKEKMEKINKILFQNILIAIGIVIYGIFINLGYKNINEQSFITDLKVFSIMLIITTVVIFEKAYKKESTKIMLYGIEVLILSIVTMLLPTIYSEYNNLFINSVAILSGAFLIYYIVKCIVIYIKMKRKIRKNNIEKIIKK